MIEKFTIKLIIIFFLLFPSIIIVYTINRNTVLTNFLNKRIILNICGWNILHILAHYILCVFIILDNITKFIYIIILDICWYLLEYISYIIIHKNKNKEAKSEEQVYENVYKPRLDDFCFNFIGICLYIIIHYIKIF